jgi:ABC-type nitrate/sulfonate/bicarbonate transport system substrate-binding protein
MKKSMLIVLAGALIVAACTPAAPAELTSVRLMLDWVPNTNHTGLFVAQEKGYFKDAGLNVSIIQPGEVYPEQAVASGAADFGVSFQEQVTLARAATPPASLVSLAAIIQHNTSGFASLAEKNVQSPADFAGLKYGSTGSPFEEPTLRVLMACAKGDFGKLQIVNTGSTDPLALLATRQIDLAWIFYGWEGLQSKQQGLNLNVVMLQDHTDCIPDYYTPILITSEAMIKNKPDIVRAFMKAVSKGYQDAISSPDEAAGSLLKAAPELDSKLVKDSQAWLSPRYQADAPRWGEQKLAVWQAYSEWMAKNKIINQPIDAQAAFTNAFLP